MLEHDRFLLMNVLPTSYSAGDGFVVPGNGFLKELPKVVSHVLRRFRKLELQ